MSVGCTENRLYSAKEIRELTGLSIRQLEYWCLKRIIEPVIEEHGNKKFNKFSEQDLYVLSKVKHLVDNGYLVTRAADKVKSHNGKRPVIEVIAKSKDIGMAIKIAEQLRSKGMDAKFCAYPSIEFPKGYKVYIVKRKEDIE